MQTKTRAATVSSLIQKFYNKFIFASEMTYIVSGGALNSTHSGNYWNRISGVVLNKSLTVLVSFCRSVQQDQLRLRRQKPIKYKRSRSRVR